jgi:hypothetical protein
MLNFCKKFTIGVLVSILSGCLATTNLLTDGTLNSEDLNIANTMAEMTTRYCVTFKATDNGDKRSGDTAIKKLPEFKAFYAGTENWYKADVLADAAWFAIYYNKSSKKFTCGKSWDNYSEARTIQFTRRDVKERSIYDVAPKPTPRSPQNKSIESKLSEVKSLYDKNLITSQQYDDQVKRILADQ